MTDREKAARLREQMQRIAGERGFSIILLDISKVPRLGMSFVGVLLEIWERLREDGRRLVVCGPTPQCLPLLRVLRLHRLFEIYPTERAALVDLNLAPRSQERKGNDRPNRSRAPSEQISSFRPEPAQRYGAAFAFPRDRMAATALLCGIG
jgi:stage II sporulation protein AA (anti-sigma F factor antagonist)